MYNLITSKPEEGHQTDRDVKCTKSEHYVHDAVVEVVRVANAVVVVVVDIADEFTGRAPGVCFP